MCSVSHFGCLRMDCAQFCIGCLTMDCAQFRIGCLTTDCAQFRIGNLTMDCAQVPRPKVEFTGSKMIRKVQEEGRGLKRSMRV